MECEAKSLLTAERRAIFLKAIGRRAVSDVDLRDVRFLKKVMRFIKRDSSDLLSGSHEVKFFAKRGIDAIKPFNDADLKGLFVLKEGTDSWGLRHIFERHIDQFEDVFGISRDKAELARFLKQVIEEGKVIKWEPDPKGGWKIIYEFDGKEVHMVVSENEKGIVTAWPKT